MIKKYGVDTNRFDFSNINQIETILEIHKTKIIIMADDIEQIFQYKGKNSLFFVDRILTQLVNIGKSCSGNMTCILSSNYPCSDRLFYPSSSSSSSSSSCSTTTTTTTTTTIYRSSSSSSSGRITSFDTLNPNRFSRRYIEPFSQGAQLSQVLNNNNNMKKNKYFYTHQGIRCLYWITGGLCSHIHFLSNSIKN